MKLIKTEDQTSLQEILAKLVDHPGLSIAEKAELKYWAIEMKPKRVRKTHEEYRVEGDVTETGSMVG